LLRNESRRTPPIPDLWTTWSNRWNKRCGEIPRQVSADSGFCRNEEIHAARARGADVYVPDSNMAQELNGGRSTDETAGCIAHYGADISQMRTISGRVRALETSSGVLRCPFADYPASSPDRPAISKCLSESSTGSKPILTRTLKPRPLGCPKLASFLRIAIWESRSNVPNSIYPSS
jgi:hypothetical protein